MRKGSRIVLIVIASVILFRILCPIVNDISAKHIIADIETVPLPQDTQVAERFSQAGKLVGNGNGMQFFGAILIETDVSNGKFYIVYSWGNGISPFQDFDLRGH